MNVNLNARTEVMIPGGPPVRPGSGRPVPDLRQERQIQAEPAALDSSDISVSGHAKLRKLSKDKFRFEPAKGLQSGANKSSSEFGVTKPLPLRPRQPSIQVPPEPDSPPASPKDSGSVRSVLKGP